MARRNLRTAAFSHGALITLLRLRSDEGEPRAALEGHRSRVDIALVLGDNRIASWANNGALPLWSGDGRILSAPEGHTDPVTGALTLADGRLLSCSLDGTLRLWSYEGVVLAIL
jgi:WD40 repeat protein